MQQKFIIIIVDGSRNEVTESTLATIEKQKPSRKKCNRSFVAKRENVGARLFGERLFCPLGLNWSNF